MAEDNVASAANEKALPHKSARSVSLIPGIVGILLSLPL